MINRTASTEFEALKSTNREVFEDIILIAKKEGKNRVFIGQQK